MIMKKVIVKQKKEENNSKNKAMDEKTARIVG